MRVLWGTIGLGAGLFAAHLLQESYLPNWEFIAVVYVVLGFLGTFAGIALAKFLTIVVGVIAVVAIIVIFAMEYLNS